MKASQKYDYTYENNTKLYEITRNNTKKGIMQNTYTQILFNNIKIIKRNEQACSVSLKYKRYQYIYDKV